MEFPPELVCMIFSYNRLQKTTRVNIVIPKNEYGGYRRSPKTYVMSIIEYADLNYLLMIRSLSRLYWGFISLEHIALNCDVGMFREPLGTLALKNYLFGKQLTDQYLPIPFPLTFAQKCVQDYTPEATKRRIWIRERFNYLINELSELIKKSMFDSIEDVEQHYTFDIMSNYKSQTQVFVGLLMELSGLWDIQTGTYANKSNECVSSRDLMISVLKKYKPGRTDGQVMSGLPSVSTMDVLSVQKACSVYLMANFPNAVYGDTDSVMNIISRRREISDSWLKFNGAGPNNRGLTRSEPFTASVVDVHHRCPVTMGYNHLDERQHMEFAAIDHKHKKKSLKKEQKSQRKRTRRAKCKTVRQPVRGKYRKKHR